MNEYEYDDEHGYTMPDMGPVVIVGEAPSNRGSNWVAPDVRAIEPRKAEVLPPTWTAAQPVPTAMPQGNVQHIVQMKANYTDRGKGFLLVTTPLAAVGGVLGVIAGVVLASVPLLSLAALGWFWGVFAATWLCAFALHTVTSSDGIALVHTLLGWSHIGAERRFRHRLIWQMYEDWRADRGHE